MKARIGMAGVVCALAIASAFLALPAAQAASPTIKGTVTCANGKGVVGVWVRSSRQGSKFAAWKKTAAASASYSAQVSTSLPTSISLHVGCGGSTKTWGSDDFSPMIADVAGSATISVTNCVNGQCSPVIGYKAAQWAIGHLSGAGAGHALSADRVTDARTRTTWATYCLAFADSAYLNASGVWPSPTVSGSTASAHGMYDLYRARGLIQTTWQSNSGKQSFPPEGALVFYPTLTSSGGTSKTAVGHIAISVGSGYVVSANNSGSPLVRRQKFNSFAGYAGWGFPVNAGA